MVAEKVLILRFVCAALVAPGEFCANKSSGAEFFAAAGLIESREVTATRNAAILGAAVPSGRSVTVSSFSRHHGMRLYCSSVSEKASGKAAAGMY